jgi:2-iminobutanoate/2-iminopropanoate deaminase
MIEITAPPVAAFSKFAERISVPASAVVRAGDWVFVSALAPINPETGGYDILPIDQQARRCMDYLMSCLKAAGSAADRVVKCTIYCANPAYFATINSVYAEYFTTHKPARAFICVAGWFGPFDMEIECVALAAKEGS